MGNISLKSSVFISRFNDGVVIRGSETPVICRGKRAHDLVKALTDRMKTGVSKNDLLGQFPDSVRQVTMHLLDDLEKHKLLRIRDVDDNATEVTLHKDFQNLWNFLADRSQRPGETLLHWRETQFLIVGRLQAGLYVARSLAECAATRITLVVPDDEMPSFNQLEELRGKFSDVSFELMPESDFPRQQKQEMPPTWIRACGDSEFTPSGMDLKGGWYFGLLAGHLVNAFVEGRMVDILPRWMSVMRPPLENGQSGRMAEQRVALGAAALAFAIFSRNNGIEDDSVWSAPRIVGVDSRIVPITSAEPTTIRPAIAVENAGNGSASNAKVIDPDSEVIRAIFDPITGILEECDADIIQIPLSVVQLKVYAQDRKAKPSMVYGWGMNLREARLKAIQRGVLAYLHTVGEISKCGLLPAVEWSKEEAVENAFAVAEVAHETGINIDPQWRSAVIKQPESVKLYKMLELIVSASLHVEVAQTRSGHGVRGRVSVQGEVLAERWAASADLVLTETLGEACMRVQLAPPGQSIQQLSFPPPIREGAPAARRNKLRWIDLGFPMLGEQLFAAIAIPGA